MFAPYGFTTFCDDIRVEQDGRLTFVGVYQGSLIVPTFPIAIPKLGMEVLTVMPIETFFQKLIFQVYFPGGNTNEPDYFHEEIASESARERWIKMSAYADDPANIDADILKTNNFRHRAVFSPVILQNEGMIKVRVNVDGITCRVGALRVQSQESADKRAKALS